MLSHPQILRNGKFGTNDTAHGTACGQHEQEKAYQKAYLMTEQRYVVGE